MQGTAVAMIFAFIGGLGLFLFGLRILSDGLQQVAGDRMRSLLEKGTKNPVRGVLTGMATTILVQSSTATTVLTVGLVNTGLLTLRQAIGVIMGANIGTTLTTFIIGFNVKDYCLPIIGIGALIFILSKKAKPKLIAQAILGFGLMFYGLNTIGTGLAPLKDLPIFTELMLSVEGNSLLGVLIGVFFTILVQSSAATIGVMQQLAEAGAMTYQQCVPILFGDNIGTTITALFAAIGAGVAARRTAWSHTIFNVIGTIIFLPLFIIGFFEPMVIWVTNHAFALVPGFESWAMLDVKLQIAQTHAVFNISNTLIQLPFVTGIAWVVTKMVPDRTKKGESDPSTPKYIDRNFLSNPSVALAQALRETLRMGELAQEAYHNAIHYLRNPSNKESLERGMVLENAIDHLEREITDYLVLAAQNNFTAEDSEKNYIIMQALNDIERIGDHCENIFEQADYAQKYDVVFSEEAQVELDGMIELTGETLDLALKSLGHDRKDWARQVVVNENVIDKMDQDYRRGHIRRLNELKCNGNNGAVFLDVLTNLERISDHCRNLAGYVLDEEY